MSEKEGQSKFFSRSSFSSFILLSVACYWWAIYTAFPHYMLTTSKLALPQIANPRRHFRGLVRQSFLLRHDLDHSPGPRIHQDFGIRFSSLPGPCHRHSGHPLGPLRVHLRGMDHQLVGKRFLNNCGERDHSHQTGGSGSAGSDWTGKCKNIYFGLIMGGVRRPAHLSASLPVFPFRFRKVQSALLPPKDPSSTAQDPNKPN